MKRITFLFTLLITSFVFSQATTFSVNGLDYEVTSNNTVDVTGRSTGNTSTDIVIPDTVENAAITYNVIRVDDSAFWNSCSCEITSVVLGANITSLGEYSFADNNNLEITSLNINPPTIDFSVFSAMGERNIIVISATAQANYQAADVWKSAKNIIIGTTLSTPNPVLTKELDVVIDNNQISISEQNFKVNKLEILNFLGNTLIDGVNNINISELVDGVYFLRVFTDKGIVLKKIIKD